MASGNPGTRYFKMYNSILKNGRFPLSLGGVGFLEMFKNPDAIDKDTRTTKGIKPPENETGGDRLQLMFSYDEHGYMSPELSQVVQGVMLGAFTGTLIGGTNHSRENYISFMKQNQATAFQSHFEAKKQLQNKVTMGFARGAWMWGWRLSLFTGSYMFITTTISVYRGKSSLLEYVAAGGISGFIYKFKQGPKAWVIGGGLGSVLGVFCGSLSLGLMWLTGTSMEEVRSIQYQWKADQQRVKMEKLRKIRAEELDSLTAKHVSTIESTSLLDAIDIAKDENIKEQPILQENIKIDTKTDNVK